MFTILLIIAASVLSLAMLAGGRRWPIIGTFAFIWWPILLIHNLPGGFLWLLFWLLFWLCLAGAIFFHFSRKRGPLWGMFLLGCVLLVVINICFQLALGVWGLFHPKPKLEHWDLLDSFSCQRLVGIHDALASSDRSIRLSQERFMRRYGYANPNLETKSNGLGTSLVVLNNYLELRAEGDPRVKAGPEDCRPKLNLHARVVWQAGQSVRIALTGNRKNLYSVEFNADDFARSTNLVTGQNPTMGVTIDNIFNFRMLYYRPGRHRPYYEVRTTYTITGNPARVYVWDNGRPGIRLQPDAR